MTTLITGVTGLVGSRLLPRLVEAGIDCRALVRSGSSVSTEVSPVQGDILDPATLSRAVEGVSTVIHLAAVFRTPDTDLIWKVNLEGTRNLIEATRKHAPAARFILASTSNIYDASSPKPGHEDDPVAPQHAYPASKLAAEKLLRESGLTWSILRFPFVYGEGDGHLESLPTLAAQGRIAFHPAQRMSLIHHRDIAEAVKMAIRGAMDHQIINITDEAPTSIYELFGLVGQTIAPSSEPLVNPWHLHVDGSRARKLGFRPTVRTVYQATEENAM
jgi:nucleoside-diphosphate-sugar epimerase